VKKLKVGDLVYLPSHFILTKVNDDGTIKEYCELKVPYVSILLEKYQTHSDLFYRGSVWTAPNDMLLAYAAKGEKNVSYAN
jgi:hypothetical protein